MRRIVGGRHAAAQLYRALAEPAANLIHRVFEPPRPVEFAVEQGRRVGRTALDERVGPDSDQLKPVLTPSASLASKVEAMRNKVSAS